ncbi:MAG: hypothetical protein ACXWDN_00950 [Limisphaerales bacterium]
MKKSRFRLLYLPLVALYAMAFLSCSKSTKLEVNGTYIRSDGFVVDTLIIETNGSFQQTVTFNGAHWVKSGLWKLNGETIEFDRFLMAFDVDTFKHKATNVIPPELVSTEVLLVERGQLEKDSEQPAWLKQKEIGTTK